MLSIKGMYAQVCNGDRVSGDNFINLRFMSLTNTIENESNLNRNIKLRFIKVLT